MTLKLAKLISWITTLWLIGLPLGALYLLFNFDGLSLLAQDNLHLPIRWDTVVSWQWYTLWMLTVVYMAVGLAGVYFLRKAFSSFAKGHWFDLENSASLRAFAILLIVQGLAKPVYNTIASVLLSWNHPAGQKVLAITVGSYELVLVTSGIVMWVLCDLLVDGIKARKENQQFV